MTVKIRSGMFETNSSSMHVISVDGKPTYDQMIKPNRNGKIILRGGWFCREWRVYRSARSKAAYCLTFAYRVRDIGVPSWINDRLWKLETPEEALDKSRYLIDMLKRVIENHTGHEVVFVWDIENWIIDHQSFHIARKVFSDEETLKAFIFSSRSVLVTGDDNEDVPRRFRKYFYG